MNHISNQIANIRQDYCLASLDEKETGNNPVLFFEKWFQQAEHAHVMEVNAMTVSTVDAQHKPHARVVLLKGIEQEKFVFFTNYESNKGQQIAENSNVAVVFFWPELQRQVRIEGTIEKVAPEYSDEYFNMRPLGSRIGALASPQSQKIVSRDVLEKRYETLSQLPASEIQRPDHWGGYAITPEKIEFWQGRSSRMHDRIVFEKETENTWNKYRIAP